MAESKFISMPSCGGLIAQRVADLAGTYDLMPALVGIDLAEELIAFGDSSTVKRFSEELESARRAIEALRAVRDYVALYRLD